MKKLFIRENVSLDSKSNLGNICFAHDPKDVPAIAIQCPGDICKQRKSWPSIFL